ncbi:hypothetical protein HDV03_000693 [Kappamyces sp. JEL0829]|nr:hypothetical protein HDV03_000693 [Kappamyces sp. JEL0829]
MSTLKHKAEKVYKTIYSKDAKRQAQIAEYFHPQLEFLDPLVHVKSAREALAQYRFLTWFPSVKADPACVLLSTEGTRDVVVIDGIVTLGLGLGSLRLRIVSKFEFLDDKIIRHEDIWSTLDLLQRIPLFGWFYNQARLLNGWVSSKFISAISPPIAPESLEHPALRVKN